MQMTKINQADASAIDAITHVPLSATTLKVAPENVRKDSDEKADDISGLCDSIASDVGLITPLTGYVEDGVYYVTAGRRRRRALLRLKKEKRLPADIKALGVPFIVRDKAIAVEMSIAENHQRLNMTVQEELRGYIQLAEKGVEANQIAAVTGSTGKRVGQLLSLIHVAPSILDAFFDKQISLDVLKAFTLSDNHERQEQVYARFEGRNPSEYQVRRFMLDTTFDPDTRLGRLVGLEDYLAAGGKLVSDLFSDQSAPWADSALAETLAQDKIDAALDVLRDEGWGSVEFSQEEYSFTRLDKGQPVRREATAEEAERLATLRVILSDPEVADEAKDEAQDEIHQIQDGLSEWSDEQKVAGTAYVVLTYGGKLEFKRGYFSAKASGVSGSTVAAKEKPAFGHEGHQRMTRIATTAVRNAVSQDFGAAFDGYIAHMAWGIFRNRGDHGFALAFVKEGAEPAEGIAVKGDAQYEEAFGGWDDVLPRTLTGVFEYVVGLPMADKQRLFAVCVAAQLNGVENRADYRRPQAWAQIGLMAGRAKVKMSDCWTPDAEFLKGAGKKALLQSLTDMGVDAEPFAGDKKTALVEIAARKAAEKRWVPPMLASLSEVTLHEKHNTANKGAAGSFSDDEDDDFSDAAFEDGDEGLADQDDADGSTEA